MQHLVRPGHRFPAGARADANGVNFSIFSRHATRMELLLYEHEHAPQPFQVVELDPEHHRSFFFWHVYLEGLPGGTLYTWRASGPHDTRHSGHRFDPVRELVDPYACGVNTARWDRSLALSGDGSGHRSIRAVVMDDEYDWEGDLPLQRAPEDAVIYELHVGGFTRHPSAGVSAPGTFAGLMEKIPYLKSLGITDVELMPVMAFDEQDVPAGVAARGLRNFWGYSPYGFFAVHPGYCVSTDAREQRREFRDLVKALHRAGIGVILDVVLNHTAEGGADGPTIGFKGLNNDTFYHLDPDDRSRYRDFTGCGNTINCNHPLVTRFLIDCLEYWVREMHVDGFRFDLASVMVRGLDGEPQRNAPLPWAIEFSRVLRHTHLIAEAWDAGGLYHVGAFPGFRWGEWNGRYRDSLRRFVRGDEGLAGEMATRIAGSSDLYGDDGRLPSNSVNFVTCHDGFTLFDLVSYTRKHNELNGENNRDGSKDNLSWNGGVEGVTTDRAIRALRLRQVRNFLSILLVSQGVPMLLAGDETLRTQRGNNNTWCQDNPLGWLDWSVGEAGEAMLRFVRGLVALRARHPGLRRKRFLTGRARPDGSLPDIVWHGASLHLPPWQDPTASVLAFTLATPDGAAPDLHVALNLAPEPARVALPAPAAGGRWYRAVDTGKPAPEDWLELEHQPAVGEAYPLAGRAVAIFEHR